VPQPVKYKRPRRINAVSVTLAALLALGAYLTYQYFPLYLQQHEVYRILEEHGSKVAHRKALFVQSQEVRDQLRREIEAEIRRIGVNDPQLETWVDVHDHEARLGAIYSETITWVFDVISPYQRDYEVEHVITY
jgi:hypothetical protein